MVWTDRRDGLAPERCENGKAVDTGRLALVGPHAGRRVALEVLHRDVVLPGGERHVGSGDVVLQIVKGLAIARRRRSVPERFEIEDTFCGVTVDLRHGRYVAVESGPGCRLGSAERSRPQAIDETEGPLRPRLHSSGAREHRRG